MLGGSFVAWYAGASMVVSIGNGYRTGGLLGAFTCYFENAVDQLAAPAIKEGVSALIPKASDAIINGISSVLKGLVRELNSFSGNTKAPSTNLCTTPGCNIMAFPK